MCQVLHVHPGLVQRPDGNPIHLLIGLDALNLLAHPVTTLPDISADQGTRKIHYPSPNFDNLRLFSTPLNHKLFLAVVYVSPTFSDVHADTYSKVGLNGFVCPHSQVNNIDTDYRYYSPKELYNADFVVQNVLLGPDNNVSPPRMDL